LLTRDIYRDFYDDPGPTLEEKIVLAGKRICILFAGCALTLGVLDIAGVHSISSATEALRSAPVTLASLGETVRGGISKISITPSIESVRVAIPSKSFIRFSTATEPTPIDDLVEVRKQDAVSFAMTSATPSLRDMKSALPTVPVETLRPVAAVPPEPSKPVIAAKADIKPFVAAKAAIAAPAAEEIRLASLSMASAPPDFNNAPASTDMPKAASVPAAAPASQFDTPISIPLSQVPMPRAAPPISPADRLGLKGADYAKAERCLANAIYFEARSEPLRGQMAVAQVVLNRVFSPFYPNDVCSVVYQNAGRHLACQFTFACDGKSKAINERGAWARANRIARQTLDGQIYMPEVGKSTHYHAAYVQPSWAREMHRLVKLGIHAFYRPYAWGTGAEQPSWGTAAMAAEMRTKTASVKATP
jgi:spore germination cell wall hydrolase CwlJ-like protein